MKLFIGLCTATNANLSLLQSTFGSKSEYQTIATNTSRDKYSNYNSVSNLHDTGKFNSNSRSSGFYGSSFGATFERPSSNYNNGTKFRPNTYIPHPPMPEYIPPVAPLKKSENRWVPASSKQSPSDIAIDGILPEDIIIRKTKALLNKLTMEKFESISGQIFEYCQQSKIENDGKALRTVIRLTFEKACDEPAFSAMWAKLCQSMRDRMTDDIVDKTLKDKNDMPISGVLLFRTYLFDRCQQEFESGWKTKMPDLAAGEMLTDEYYAAAKAKRQGLGLIQLIGELYKLSMLSDKVIYSCLVKLCDDPNNAEDEDVESLCRLLSTVGKTLDSKPKTSPWLDEFIGRIQGEMSASEKLTSRAKFMILDLAELRSNQWVPHSGVKPSEPTTLSEVREQVDKASSTRKSFRF
ncbi:armadillo-type protein [Sporodiniella umbellata]|nr:armadillo-type protein [Sporodiniella umbellata]